VASTAKEKGSEFRFSGVVSAERYRKDEAGRSGIVPRIYKGKTLKKWGNQNEKS
jgi:hypothetical protein